MYCLSIFKENLLLEKGPGCWQVRGVKILPAKCRITDIFWVGLFFFGWAVNNFNSLINISEKHVFLQNLCPFSLWKAVSSILGDAAYGSVCVQLFMEIQPQTRQVLGQSHSKTDEIQFKTHYIFRNGL